MSKIQLDKEAVEQHIKDVNNVIKDLKTITCNISPISPSQTWESIKEIRTKHCESYLKLLKAQEEQFAHFQ